MTVTMKHVVTGLVADYPDHYLDSPVFADILVPCDERVDCVDCELPAEPEPVFEVPEPGPVFVIEDEPQPDIRRTNRRK